MPVVFVKNFGNVKLDGSNAGSIESVWDNYPELRPPTDTLLPDAALVYCTDKFPTMERATALALVDRYNALGGGGVVTMPQEIIDLIQPEPPPPEDPPPEEP